MSTRPAQVGIVGLGYVGLPLAVTFAEAGVKGVVVVNWYGLIAPAKTPQPNIARLATETGKAMAAPDMAKNLLGEGSEAVRSSPAEFAAHLKAESELWTRVVKTAGIRGL